MNVKFLPTANISSFLFRKRISLHYGLQMYMLKDFDVKVNHISQPKILFPSLHREIGNKIILKGNQANQHQKDVEKNKTF